MSISLRTKYLSIKKDKLSETAKGLLKSMYEATDGFKDAKATKKLKPKFDAFYDKLVKSKPEAIKGASKPKESSAASSFKEARERRQSQAGVPKGESDIKKDAGRPAIDVKGKRVTDGKHYPYKKGNVYYEYRDNRYDKRPAKYPKLEDGGMMAKGGMFEAPIAKIKEVSPNSQLKEFKDYVKSFYGKGETYADFFPPYGASDKEIMVATKMYYDWAHTKKDQWGGGDSFDREIVRDIMLYNRGQKDGLEFEKIVKEVEENFKKADGGMMAKGGYVAVSEKDGYWYIMSTPTSKEKAHEIINMGVPRGEVGKVVTLKEAKEHKKVIGEEYLEDGGMMAKGGLTKEGNRLMHYEPYFEKDVIVAFIDEDKKEVRPTHGYFYPNKIAKKVISWAHKNGYEFNQDDKKYADGGHLQGYDDREDERLSMEHGKMAHKDFVGSHERMEHSRRDDARFEEKMADGGETNTFYNIFKKFGFKEIKSAYGLIKFYQNFNGNSYYGTIDDRGYQRPVLLEKFETASAKNNYKYGNVEYEGNSVNELIKKLKEIGFKEEMADGGMMAKGGNLDAKYIPDDVYKYAVKDKYIIGFQGKEDILYFKSEQQAKDYVKEKPSMREYLDIKMADGGMMDEVNTEVIAVKGNIMGTTTLEMKIKGMKKPQNFIVYPISANQAGKPIMIQSDTRFGYLDLSSGRGLMSQSHPNGAYSHHFTMDKKVPFKISDADVQKIKADLSSRAGSKVGNSVIFSDNSGAGMMAKGGEMHRIKGGDMFAEGGEIDNGNVEMVMSNTKAIEHHAKELKELVNMNTPIEAWVVAKLERAETDLSDVTHYIDGLKKYADGGELDGHDVEIYFNMKDKVADPYTVIIDGSVYSMSGTTGANSVNMYVGEMEEFEPQAVRGWGKKIDFVNADPALISQIEERFEDKMADGGMMAKGGKIDYSKQTSDDFQLGEIVWDTDNKRYGTIIGIYDGYLSDKYEVRLDTDGMQPTENLRKLGSEGDKGTKEQLKEEVELYARLIKSYPKNDYPKQLEPMKMAKGGGFTQYGKPMGFEEDYDSVYEIHHKPEMNQNNPYLIWDKIDGVYVAEFPNRQRALHYIENKKYGYKHGGMMADGGEVDEIAHAIYPTKYFDKPNPSNLYALMKLDEESGYGSLADGKVYTINEAFDVREKLNNDLENTYTIEIFTVEDLLRRKTLPKNSKEIILENYRIKKELINYLIERFGEKIDWQKDFKKGGMMAKGGEISNKEKLIKELQKLQTQLNSSRLSSYRENDNSEEEMARQKERASKLARFNEILKLLHEDESKHKMSKGGELSVFEKNQIRIAKDTLKMSDVGASIMGGMTKDEAKKILQKYKVKYANGGTLKTKAKYIPKYQIEEVEVDINGKQKEIDGADLLDGLYVKKASYDKKAPVKKAKGGEVKPESKKTGNKSVGEIAALAKSIRKEGEKWTEAIKRAAAQMKSKK